MKESNRDGGFGRRSFLKYTTAAAAGLSGMGTVSAAGPKASQVQVVTGSRVDPISQEEIEAARTAAMEDYLDRGGERPDRLAGADPASHAGGEIVSYVYQIDANGVPRQYTGIAGDTASVGTLQRKAHAKADQFASTETVSTNEVSTQNHEWDLFFQDQADFCKDPYGCVTNNFEIHDLTNDGDSVQDAYACKQIFAMEPGEQKYGSGWENWRGRPKHDWEGEHGGEDLAEWDPLGTHDGQQTISVNVGTGGAGMGWSYTQPAVETIDESSPSSNYAKWLMKYNTDSARSNTNGMKPGSSTWVDDQPYGSGKVDLMYLVAEGEFRNVGFWSTDYHTLKHTWTLWIEY